MATSKGIRIVRESFWVKQTLMKHGATVRDTHPFVKQFPEHFYPEDYVDFEWPEKG